MARQPDISTLVVDEAFAQGDVRFVEYIRQLHSPKPLVALVERWRKDPRPWARQQMLAYIDQPMNVAGHEPVVKRLFKQAEEQRDDGLMAAFMAAFDRLARRQVRKRHRWDPASRSAWSEEYLYSPIHRRAAMQNPRTLERLIVPSRDGGRLFSYHTRYHLRRRAWRYFRRMGFQKPQAYPSALAAALRWYRDEDLARGENLLDCWSLMHACFGKSEAIAFGASLVKVAEGKGLGDLTAAPPFLKLWQRPESAAVLFDLVLQAPARPIRVWAIELLRREHKQNLAGLSVDALLKLLDHPDAEIQQFGADLFSTASGLEKLPLATWLKLLGTQNMIALGLIVQAMQRHVSAERLDLSQTIQLASAEAVPVARLGLDFLRTRTFKTPADRDAIAQLSKARCASVAGELATFALGILGTAENYRVEQISGFFDSLLEPARRSAWDWLTPQSAGYHDSALWSRLIETPYDDIRTRLVATLQSRSRLPGIGVSALSALWCTVLLNVQRGGRAKLKAVRQISAAILDDPAGAETLLPVLAVAIRSVRLPEARAGLSAIVGALEAAPQLAPAVARYLPELELLPVEVNA